MNSSTLVAAGIGLVFGLAGGVAGAVLTSAPPSLTDTRDTPSAPADPALRTAIEELTREVRALHESLGNRLESPARQTASTSAPLDLDGLTAAIERLAANAGALPAPAGGTSRHALPLAGIDRPRNVPRLRELLQDDYEVRSRKNRFLTYQQVLDQFGAPDDVFENGKWFYDLAEAGQLEFQFYDGMLTHIY